MKPYWIELDSSNLLRVKYRRAPGRMDVIFRADPGVVYTYDHVDLADYVAIVMADSVGAKFNELIRSRPTDHPYRRRRA